MQWERHYIVFPCKFDILFHFYIRYFTVKLCDTSITVFHRILCIWEVTVNYLTGFTVAFSQYFTVKSRSFLQCAPSERRLHIMEIK